MDVENNVLKEIKITDIMLEMYMLQWLVQWNIHLLGITVSLHMISELRFKFEF